MQYTLIWEDSYASGVCKFKAFNNFRYMCDYIAKYFKTGALWNARAINDTKTIWFIDKELEDCCKQVKKDLEVLEILKKHLKIDTDYCGTSEFATHTAISLCWDNEELLVDSKEGKEHKLVKEWLTNDR